MFPQEERPPRSLESSSRIVLLLGKALLFRQRPLRDRTPFKVIETASQNHVALERDLLGVDRLRGGGPLDRGDGDASGLDVPQLQGGEAPLREAALPDNRESPVDWPFELLIQREDIRLVSAGGLRREDWLPKGLDRPYGPAPVRGHLDNGHPRVLVREAAGDDCRLPVLAGEREHEGERR